VVAKLNRNREYVEEYLRHAQNFLQLRKEMALFLNGERSPKAAESFFDDWQQVDGFIYGSIRSQMRYGATALRQIKCEQVVPESHLRKVIYHKDPDAQYFAGLISDIRRFLEHSTPTDSTGERQSLASAEPPTEDTPTPDRQGIGSGTNSEHIYSVTKIGGRYKSRFDIGSTLDENEIVTTPEEECAENVMAALADFDKEKLNAILDLTDQEAKELELHKKIQSDLDKYIKGYSLWNVSVLISNRGKNPISFSPNATLYVDMSGSKVNNGHNLSVGLRRQGDVDAIVVPGGESRAVSFTSSDLIRENDDWKSVLAAYEQSSRDCIVVLYPQTGDWQHAKKVFSPVKLFGPPAKAGPTDAENISEHFKGRPWN
jgi:hypothetical protein